MHLNADRQQAHFWGLGADARGDFLLDCKHNPPRPRFRFEKVLQDRRGYVVGDVSDNEVAVGKAQLCGGDVQRVTVNDLDICLSLEFLPANGSKGRVHLNSHDTACISRQIPGQAPQAWANLQDKVLSRDFGSLYDLLQHNLVIQKVLAEGMPGAEPMPAENAGRIAL
jgi:hypothetical protein